MHQAEHKTEHYISLCCCHIYYTEGCECSENVSCTQDVLLRFKFEPCSSCKDVLNYDQARTGNTLVLGWAARGYVAYGDELDDKAVQIATELSEENYYFGSAKFNFEQNVKRILEDLWPSRIHLLHFVWDDIAKICDEDYWIKAFVNFIVKIACEEFGISTYVYICPFPCSALR